VGEPLSYRAAGVDLDAASDHTSRIAGFVSGGVTGFAGAVPLPQMRDPLLVSSTDGVGTKLLLAQELGRLEGLGQDLVAMCVNDLICVGARPLVFLDYLAVGKLDPNITAELVASIAAACAVAGCALVGGETAELPGLYAKHHFDLAGFASGVVERDDVLGPERVEEGDLIVGVPSSGLHSNGYSLVRKLIEERALLPDAGLLLEPTRIYVAEVLEALRLGVRVRSAAHITGGGLPENLPRALPDGMGAELDRSSWDIGDAGRAILETGRVDEQEAFRTFNMGLGMCLVVAPESAERLTGLIAGARVVGTVQPGATGVEGV
jgi:phosphoribosylformylglycinamidine cyclo-ligase